MSKHKNEDYKITAIKYYLNNVVSLILSLTNIKNIKKIYTIDMS